VDELGFLEWHEVCGPRIDKMFHDLFAFRRHDAILKVGEDNAHGFSLVHHFIRFQVLEFP